MRVWRRRRGRLLAAVSRARARRARESHALLAPKVLDPGSSLRQVRSYLAVDRSNVYSTTDPEVLCAALLSPSVGACLTEVYPALGVSVRPVMNGVGAGPLSVGSWVPPSTQLALTFSADTLRGGVRLSFEWTEGVVLPLRGRGVRYDGGHGYVTKAQARLLLGPAPCRRCVTVVRVALGPDQWRGSYRCLDCALEVHLDRISARAHLLDWVREPTDPERSLMSHAMLSSRVRSGFIVADKLAYVRDSSRPGVILVTVEAPRDRARLVEVFPAGGELHRFVMSSRPATGALGPGDVLRDEVFTLSFTEAQLQVPPYCAGFKYEWDERP